MRKTTALIIAALLMISLLAACGARNAETQTEAPETADTAAAPVLNAGDDTDEYGDLIDTSIDWDNVCNVKGVEFALPHGFTVTESDGVTFATPPEDLGIGDNINVVVTGTDSIDNSSEEVLGEYYSSMFSGFEGFDYYEQVEIDGRDAIIAEYYLTVSDVDMLQDQVFIYLDDCTVCVTYTLVDGVYIDAFADSIDSITIN